MNSLRWFTSRRFRSPMILFAAGVLLQAAPVSGAGWAGFVLLIIFFGTIVRATWLLPHERRKIKRAKECLERLEIEKARKFLKKRALINGIPFEVERGLLLSRCCFQENDWVGAYSALNDISRYYLLPRETVKHRQQKGFLYFNVGNCRDFMSLFRENMENLTGHDDLAGTALLRNYWREFQEDFPGAKSELETAMTDLQDARDQKDFVHRGLKAYKGAESLLLKRLERPEFQSQMTGMAYYALHLGMGKDAVAFWFTHASRRGVQLQHYAIWLRSQYQKVRAFLDPDKS